jgi:hypothetical protein
MKTGDPKKILAVSSSGGHWAELLRLRPAFEGHQVVYITTQKDSARQVPDSKVYIIGDAHRGKKLELIWMLLVIAMIVIRERPSVALSTGAAPGYFAIRFARYFGARTLWLDSIANGEQLSLSARLVQPYADLWLTQWPHMARPDGPEFRGSVL